MTIDLDAPPDTERPSRSLRVVLDHSADPEHVTEGLDTVHGGMTALRVVLDRCRCLVCVESRGGLA